KTIVSKLVKSIIIIILLPTIFKYMQIFQNNILSSNVIGNIILGSSSGSAPDNSLKTAGTSMALSIGQAFYHPVDSTGKEYSYLDCIIEENKTSVPACANFIEAYDKALENNTPGYFFGDSNIKKQLNLNPWERLVNSEREMTYYAILSTIAAILAIQMIVAFALDIGIRVAKLGFLQIIAPIPIAQNITKKEPLSQTEWFRSLVETYLEIFMKLIIIYFSMFAITLVPEVIENIFHSNQSDAGTLVKMLATVVIILGILQFAKNAPELIKKLFNIKDLANGISIKKRLNDNTYAQRGAAMLGGAGASAISSAFNGGGVLGTSKSLFSGGYRGLKNSEGMTSWGQLGGNINRARAETDAARTASEARSQAARERFTDAHGNKMWGGSVFGRVPLAKDDLLDFGQRSKDWVHGGISNEKLSATNSTIGDFTRLDNALNENDNDIKAIKDRREKSRSDYYKDNIIPDIVYNNNQGNDIINKIIDAEKQAYITEHGSISQQQANQIEIDVSQDYNGDKKAFEKKYAKYEKEIADVIDGHYKSSINNRKVANMAKKKDVTLEYGKTVSKSLQDTINILGSQKGQTILGNEFNSIAEFEKAYVSLANEQVPINERLELFDKISNVENRLKDENTIQKIQKEQQNKKDK
ncbi:MAG: hypothetical protein PHD03_03965, partial [Bacilli bacterium]|nr:hypothetical protein [Bacilli bacterium]